MTSPAPLGGLRRGLVLAVDQGTTTTKALVLDADDGSVLATAGTGVPIAFPAPGWVEQDADAIWRSTLSAVTDALAAVPDGEVRGIGISSQRESVVCWSRSTGEPLGPVLGWQDARTAAWCADLEARQPGSRDLVATRTGLSLDPMFSAPKMRAALDAAVAAGARREDVVVGTVDAWLVRTLTGEHATERGNASRTLLLNIATGRWDQDLLALFGIESHHLPEVRASDAGFGVTRAGLGSLAAGVPVVAVLADSHAALFHHGCTSPGSGKATYGTGTSVMTPVSDELATPEGIATTVAWDVGGRRTYAREGNIVASGSALDWMAETLGAPDGLTGGAFLSELAEAVEDNGGVCFVPAFSGLGAPHWDRDAVGVLAGVTRGSRRGHLARAALEAVAHQVTDVVEAMEADGSARIGVLRADGGATGSDLLMQIQADLLRRPVEVAAEAEASALGVARLAADVLGLAPPRTTPGRTVTPRTTDSGARREQWRAAVARSRGTHPDHTPSKRSTP